MVRSILVKNIRGCLDDRHLVLAIPHLTGECLERSFNQVADLRLDCGRMDMPGILASRLDVLLLSFDESLELRVVRVVQGKTDANGSPLGPIETVGDFQQYDTLADAVASINQ